MIANRHWKTDNARRGPEFGEGPKQTVVRANEHKVKTTPTKELAARMPAILASPTQVSEDSHFHVA